MWLIVYSNDHAPLTVKPIYSSSKLRTAQIMIFSLVAMIGLEKCCITSACLQWLCHSSERTVARGPLVCHERDFMKSLSRENQADIIEAFDSTSRYLDDLLNIDNIYFDQMVDRIYPTELQLNRANSSDTEAPFLDLNLHISNGMVSTKIYDKREDFDFDIVNFPFLDGDVPRRTS